jgi:hypothetical protein
VVRNVLAAPGHPLETPVRASMEHGFGHDFSRVRIHADRPAEESARAVNAHAYTVGHHIVFGAGQYAPSTRAGEQLLAHELTHVVQHGVGSEGAAEGRTLSHPADPSEREAETVAARVMSGRPVRVSQPVDAAVQGLGLGEGLAIGAGAVGVGVGIAALFGAFSGKNNCAATHTIPDDTYNAIGQAWTQSGHGGATVTEQGGRMVKTAAGQRAIRTGSGGSGSISLPAEQPGDATLGTFHTHPYSTSEGSHIGVPFSGGDIVNFIAGGQGDVKYIGAGSCNYALQTRDTAARDACKTVDINKRYNDAFTAASGSLADRADTAVKAAIADCGLCYYKACRPDATSPIPKAASLA